MKRISTRLAELEARLKTREPWWKRRCPECGQGLTVIVTEDYTTNPPTFYPFKPCPTCVELRRQLPPEAGMVGVEIVLGPTREEIENRRALREEFEVE